MDLSRRELLSASAAVLAGSRAAISVAAATELHPGARAEAAGQAGAPMILCWNENPYGPSPAARAAIAASIAGACRYPDDEVPQLVDMLARKEGVSSDRVVTGTGSGELLRALGWLNGRDRGEIIAAEPTYLELPDYAHHTGATLKFVAVDKQLRHDLPAMQAAVSNRTRAVYLCNPNNPTGTALGAKAIESFVHGMPDHVTTIIDEAYLDFADAPDVRTATGLIDTGKRVVVLRTFSKIHGMAGVRCGYAIARPEIIAEIAAARMTTPNIFAMRAARASLGDHSFLADCRSRILASRKRITSGLEQLGLAYAHPQGNFVFFDTGAPLARFTAFMKERNILVGRHFPPYDSWCRITIGTEPQVDAFLRGLQAFAGRRAARAA
ncbi:MAG TPA: histidinol-phosphate transaminase [Steroidobacteraceae bacterium]